MSRRRKITWLVVLLVLAGGSGGYCWYWRSTAVDRKVRQLVYEAAGYPDTRTERILRKMKLDFLIREKPKSRRDDGMMFWEESVIVKEIEAIGIAATPELLSMLKDENNDIRYKAAEFLGRIRDARSIEPLIQILQTEHDLKV